MTHDLNLLVQGGNIIEARLKPNVTEETCLDEHGDWHVAHVKHLRKISEDACKREKRGACQKKGKESSLLGVKFWYKVEMLLKVYLSLESRMKRAFRTDDDKR